MSLFRIQAGNPATLAVHEPDDGSLSDALQTVFPLDTEYGIVIWNHLFVPFGYKYDFSVMVNDVLGMLDALLAHDDGALHNTWASNTFAGDWHLRWRAGMLLIHASWGSVIGNTEALLDQQPDVELPVADFIAEWRRPLRIAERALTAAGYDPASLPEMARLRAVLSRCPRDGALYSTTSGPSDGSSGAGAP